MSVGGVSGLRLTGSLSLLLRLDLAHLSMYMLLLDSTFFRHSLVHTFFIFLFYYPGQNLYGKFALWRVMAFLPAYFDPSPTPLLFSSSSNHSVLFCNFGIAIDFEATRGLPPPFG